MTAFQSIRCSFRRIYAVRLIRFLAFAAMASGLCEAATPARDPIVPPSSPNSTETSGGKSDYLIRRNDVLQIVVFNESELTIAGRVRRDGTIQCPLVGSVHVDGLTQQGAAKAVEQAYKNGYLVKPEVNLYVSTFSVQRVTVLGQVGRPGAIDLPAETQLTVLQLLGLAGGASRVANLSKVTITRVGTDGKEQIIRVDVAAMSKGKQSMMVYVEEGDVITVPESLF